jgi:hypothetical protein
VPRKAFNFTTARKLVGGILKRKRTQLKTYWGADNDDKFIAAHNRGVRGGKTNVSESTEICVSKSSRPESSLQIWHRSEYSVDTNDHDTAPRNDIELYRIWDGEVGTTSKAEAERSASNDKSRKP